MKESEDAVNKKADTLCSQMYAASSRRLNESAAARAIAYMEKLEGRLEFLDEMYDQVRALRRWCDDIPEEDEDLVQAYITPLCQAIKNRRSEVSGEECRIRLIDREFQESSWRNEV